jgi:uncharacterized protein (TIGR00255 family)
LCLSTSLKNHRSERYYKIALVTRFPTFVQMIRSMTGYGIATAEYQQKNISVEIKSVNSKFFDLTLRIPNAYKEKEMELRSDLARFIERGKSEVSISIESQEAIKKANINKPLLKGYYDELKKIDDELQLKTPNYLQLILAMPDVLVSEKIMLSDEEWNVVSAAVKEAMNRFQQFREAEGDTAKKDLLDRISGIQKCMDDLSKYESGRIELVRKRLQGNLEEFIQTNNIDRNRFEQELIFYIEKFDISEEKVRLKSHCDYFVKTAKEETSNGKKLSFISQEIGREINTIGSKANDADMQRIVVVMKDELEKIKEQVLNIL